MFNKTRRPSPSGADSISSSYSQRPLLNQPESSNASGKREKHGVLGILTRPFHKRSSSPPKVQISKASQQQPRTAIDSLREQHVDLPALAVAITNHVCLGNVLPAHFQQALDKAGVDTHLDGNLDGNHHPLLKLQVELRPFNPPAAPRAAPPRRPRPMMHRNAPAPERPGPSRQPGSPRQEATPAQPSTPMHITHAQIAQANTIVRELKAAGVNLTQFHNMLSNLMDGHNILLDAKSRPILLTHFPDLARQGLTRDNPAARLLHDAINHQLSVDAQPRPQTPSKAPAKSSRQQLGPTPRNEPPYITTIIQQVHTSGGNLSDFHGVLTSLMNVSDRPDRIHIHAQVGPILQQHFPNFIDGIDSNNPLANQLDQALRQRLS